MEEGNAELSATTLDFTIVESSLVHKYYLACRRAVHLFLQYCYESTYIASGKFEEEVTEMRFYVGGISPSISKDDIEKLFSRLAPVEEVHCPHSDIPAFTRNFMIVRLRENADANAVAAVNKLNGSTWKGTRLRIEPAKPFFKDSLQEEKRIEAEKEAAPKATIPKFNKKAVAVLKELIPETERKNIPKRPAYLRIRRSRCTPALRITQPVLLVNEECYKAKNVEIDARMKFAKHILFDENQVQNLLESAQIEPFVVKPIVLPTPGAKKDKNGKDIKLSKKEEETIEIVKKPAIGGGQRKGFGSLLVADANTNSKANARPTNASNSHSQGGNQSQYRFNQISEHEMIVDSEDDDDDDIVRRFPMPQTNIEYPHADMSTGKTKILTEEETIAERQRMLQIAMMSLAAPVVTFNQKDNKEKQPVKTTTEKVNSTTNETNAVDIKNTTNQNTAPVVASAEKRVQFRTNQLEEIREIPARKIDNDMELFGQKLQPRLDDAIRQIFGAPAVPLKRKEAPTVIIEYESTDNDEGSGSSDKEEPNTTSNSIKSATTLEDNAHSIPAHNENNNMKAGYADMSTLKSIFDSGEQGGIWWDDNVGKAVVSAAEERGQGFQNDEIFRAAEKYGIDVRMFDFSLPSNTTSGTGTTDASTTKSTATGASSFLSMTAAVSSEETATNSNNNSNSMVFDFFGDGASVAPSAAGGGAPSFSVASKQISSSSSSSNMMVVDNATSVVTEVLSSNDPSSVKYVYLHDYLYTNIVPQAKRFQRERSEEDIQRDWERNRTRLFTIVTKKAKVAKKQALASTKSSFRKFGNASGSGEKHSYKKKHNSGSSLRKK